MCNQNPRVSIITVVYNGEKYIESCIQSVIHQTYENIEYIIIDGYSNDKTHEIIKKYQKFIHVFISEKDKGLYDALNKGIELSSGEFIGIVNSDDMIYPQSIELLVKEFTNSKLATRMGLYSFGPVDLINSEGEITGNISPFNINEAKQRINLEVPFPHMSMYLQRRIFDIIGLYDIKLKIGADYDFMIRLLNSDQVPIKLNFTIGAFRTTGISSNVFLRINDLYKIHRKHNLPHYLSILILFRSIFLSFLYSLLPMKMIVFLKKFRRSKHTYIG